uniref:Uncharacterized protein n=1 Tax=Megaselia scalaris TaxID=36166 RepID=T1GR02_MEGSC
IFKISEIFSGIVEIRFKVVNSTTDIYLHTKFSNISQSDVTLKDINGQNIFVGVKAVPDRELIYINVLNGILFENSVYTIKVYYSSKLRTDKLGFHLTSYVDGSGRKIDIAATQFAPTEARHAFPCFDEPSFKAKFTVSVIHPKEYHAIGNMDIESDPVEMPLFLISHHDLLSFFRGNQYITKFKETPLLSTYLVSFIVSNLPHTVLQQTSFKQELYAKEVAQHLVKDGEKFAADVLQKFMDTWTTAPLPLKTMKQVAIPNFYFSGMENFGSVFYNEQKWFYDPTIHSVEKLLSLKALLSHEMSHQWFGDMVTMDWWTHVWLNEGFATLMGYYGTEMIDPESNIMQKYQTEVFMNAMKVDEAEDIRKMSQYVEDPVKIMQHYDKIAYDKASCVIRMF